MHLNVVIGTQLYGVLFNELQDAFACIRNVCVVELLIVEFKKLPLCDLAVP